MAGYRNLCRCIDLKPAWGWQKTVTCGPRWKAWADSLVGAKGCIGALNHAPGL